MCREKPVARVRERRLGGAMVVDRIRQVERGALLYTHPALPEGWEIERTSIDGARGFLIHTPREDGVRGSTAIFEDSASITDRLLFKLLEDIEL